MLGCFKHCRPPKLDVSVYIYIEIHSAPSEAHFIVNKINQFWEKIKWDHVMLVSRQQSRAASQDQNDPQVLQLLLGLERPMENVTGENILVTSREVLHPSSYWAIFTIIYPALCRFLPAYLSKSSLILWLGVIGSFTGDFGQCHLPSGSLI